MHANASAAGQPSVLSHRSSTSSGPSWIPPRSTTSSRASARVNVSSRARSSSRSPRPRSRASPSPGSTREIMTSRAARGRRFTAWSIVARHSSSSSGLHVVEHDQHLFSGGGDRVHQRVDGAFDGASGVTQPLESIAPETFVHTLDGGRRVRPEPDRVVVADVERDPGRRAARRAAHHARTAVVFPYPAGAATSVTGMPCPASSATESLGRATSSARSRGAASLASASGTASSP